jgi:hypothetical protein
LFWPSLARTKPTTQNNFGIGSKYFAPQGQGLPYYLQAAVSPAQFLRYSIL